MTDIHNDVLADEDFDTILSADIDFDGDINFERSLLVQGKLAGTIDAKGILLVDTGASVQSDIKADKVIVRGAINGNIAASEQIVIEASGKITGNMDTPELSVEGGARFNGNCTMS
jgi:cytoskeletal protein CcmA (bactofilin family)